MLFVGLSGVSAQISDRERGIELFKEKKYAEAVELFQKSVKAEGSDVVSLHYLGLSFENLDDPAEAVRNHTLAYQKGLYICEKLLADAFSKQTRFEKIETIDAVRYVVEKIGTKLETALKSAERLEQLKSASSDAKDAARAILIFKYFSNIEKSPVSWDLNENAENRQVKFTTKSFPRHTKQSLKNRTSGEIHLFVMFLSNGEIGLVVPKNRLPDGLTESSVEAAKKMKFEPAMKNGEPITVSKTVVYTIY